MMRTTVIERSRSVRRIASSAAGLAALITVGLGAATPACAEEIRILSASALQSAFPEIARGFEGVSGHTPYASATRPSAPSHSACSRARPRTS
jgi:ABC-type molybdate transport system substrate-binding protein